MTTLRSRFMLPTLLAGAAALTACSPGEQEQLHGMTNAVQGLCVKNSIESQKWACVSVADEQATFLANYVGPKGEFKQACDFSRPPEVEGSVEAVLTANASRIERCLDAVDKKASAGVKAVSAEIRNSLARGLQ